MEQPKIISLLMSEVGLTQEQAQNCISLLSEQARLTHTNQLCSLCFCDLFDDPSSNSFQGKRCENCSVIVCGDCICDNMMKVCKCGHDWDVSGWNFEGSTECHW